LFKAIIRLLTYQANPASPLPTQHHAMCMLLRLQGADAAEVKRLRETGAKIFSDVVDREGGRRDWLPRGA
jgi:hypothetical protein